MTRPPKRFWLLPAIVGGICYAVAIAIYAPSPTSTENLIREVCGLAAVFCATALILMRYSQDKSTRQSADFTFTHKYSCVVRWSESDQEWIARCPEFPALSGIGATRHEALTELGIAIGLVIKTYHEKQWPLPEPMLMLKVNAFRPPTLE